MCLIFCEHIIKSYFLQNYGEWGLQILHKLWAQPPWSWQSMWGNGTCPCEQQLQKSCGTCQPRDNQCHWKARAGGGQNNMGWVTNVCVILAQGKIGSLGNNRNNVTRQDEPSACFWVMGTSWGVGFRGGREREGRLSAGGQGRPGETVGSEFTVRAPPELILA